MFSNPLQLVLAFGITTPMLLWGAALGSIPIIVHLLHKRKYRETNWAAMRFLLEAARKNSRRVRLEQLLLLVVRTLILLFLVGALQGIYFESISRVTDDQGPAHHVIVIDASFSMQYKPNQQASRFETARKTALKIVDAAHPGDLINVVLIRGSSKRVVIASPAKSKKWVRGRIENAKAEADAGKTPELVSSKGSMPSVATQEVGRLLPTLTDVGNILKKTSVSRKNVYFISDFQKTTWAPTSKPQREGLRRTMKVLAENASLRLIDIGNRTSPNTAVTRFESETPYAIAGQTVELTATVWNFSRETANQQTVNLYVNGLLRDSKTVDLKPNAEQNIRFIYPPAQGANIAPPLETGEYYMEVRLQDDRLNVDNTRGLAFPVKQELTVLLVDGNPGGSRRSNATLFLKKALRPTTAAGDWQGIIRPKVITETELIGTDLSNIDCIFLCNISLFQENEARKLRAYAENGGGLVFCMGGQVRIDNYNDVLYRDGDGILPVKLGDRVDSPHLLDTTKLTHPLVEMFRGIPGAGLERVICYRYHRTQPLKTSGSRVVLRFKNQGKNGSRDPVILESPLGQGRTILVTTSFNAQWGTWPATASFPPLINELVHFAVAGRWNHRQYTIGEPLERGFPVSSVSLPKSIQVKPPDGQVREISLSSQDRWRTRSNGANVYENAPKDGKTTGLKITERIAPKTPVRKLKRNGNFSFVQWHEKTGWVNNDRLERIGYPGLFFTETLKRGPYEVLLRPPLGRVEQYAVNVDSRESNLESISEKGLQSDVMAGVRFEYRRDYRDDHPPFLLAMTEQNSLTRWLLIAAICLTLTEQLMAWKFLPGFLLLGVFIAAEFTRVAFRWQTSAGIVVVVTIFVALSVLFLQIRKQQRKPGSHPFGQRNVRR